MKQHSSQMNFVLPIEGGKRKGGREPSKTRKLNSTKNRSCRNGKDVGRNWYLFYLILFLIYLIYLFIFYFLRNFLREEYWCIFTFYISLDISVWKHEEEGYILANIYTKAHKHRSISLYPLTLSISTYIFMYIYKYIPLIFFYTAFAKVRAWDLDIKVALT